MDLLCKSVCILELGQMKTQNFKIAGWSQAELREKYMGLESCVRKHPKSGVSHK